MLGGSESPKDARTNVRFSGAPDRTGSDPPGVKAAHLSGEQSFNRAQPPCDEVRVFTQKNREYKNPSYNAWAGQTTPRNEREMNLERESRARDPGARERPNTFACFSQNDSLLTTLPHTLTTHCTHE